jgi:hypothetical protein
MPTQTLAEAKKFIDDDIIAGVAQDIITLNPIYASLPFTGYAGQALLVNRENVLGDSQFLAIDGTITAKNQATYTQIPFTATKIIGDAEMDNLVQIQSVGAGVDQLAIEISSKAKSIGRQFQQGMVTGTGTAPQMNSFATLTDASQYTAASAGQAIAFELLDQLALLVTAKDGQLDWIMMSDRTFTNYKKLLRALGGTTIDSIVTLPDGRTTIGYENIPVFVNQYMSKVETANGAANTGGALSSVYAGVWDDGTQKVGVSAIHPIAAPAGIMVEAIGQMETKDAEVVRIKQYANLALFNRRGLARLPSINN